MSTATSRTVKAAALVAFVALLVLAERRWQLSSRLSPGRMEALVRDAGLLGPVLLASVMAVAVVVSPIPSLPIDIVAGQLYGPWWGTLFAAAGATVGAVASFGIGRVLGRELLAPFLKGHVSFCRECSDRLLAKVVFVSRLLPFVAFDLVSYGAGLTKMSASRFAVATFLGMLPLTFIYTAFGAALLERRWLAWVGGVVMVATFFLLPRWIERRDPFGMRRYFEHGEEDGGSSRGDD